MLSINGKTVPKGRYVLYAIPWEKEWTIILNNDLYTWGLKIDSTKDAYQIQYSHRQDQFPLQKCSPCNSCPWKKECSW